MAQGDEPPSFDDLDARLARLRRPSEQARGSRRDDGSGRLNWGSGIQVGIEVLAGVVGGSLIGYGLDRWLETSPLFLIVFFALGAAAGILNAYRTMRRMVHEDPAGAGDRR
jgi:ATP synthase protein I